MEGLRRVFTQGVRLRGADQSKCKGESSQKKEPSEVLGGEMQAGCQRMGTLVFV